jgi:hypothetical protein
MRHRALVLQICQNKITQESVGSETDAVRRAGSMHRSRIGQDGEGRRRKGETRRRRRGRRMKIRIILCVGTARGSALSPTCIFKMGKLWQPATPALLPPIAAPRPPGTTTASSVICSRTCVEMTHCWGACCPGCGYGKFLIIPPLYFRYTLSLVLAPRLSTCTQVDKNMRRRQMNKAS